MQPLSLQQLIDRARSAGQQLPAEEAGLLFAAAVRLGAEQGAPLRPARLLLLASGALALASRDEVDDRPGYLAPELSSAVLVGDFDGDGVPDVAVGGGAKLCVLLNDGMGNLSPPIVTEHAGWATAEHRLVVADFNEDGISDIADNFWYSNGLEAVTA